MFNRKQLLSQYAKNAETYDKRHSSTQSKMEERRVEAANMKKLYMEKTNSLIRLRNKGQIIYVPEEQCKIFLGIAGTFMRGGTLCLSSKDVQSDKTPYHSQPETV